MLFSQHIISRILQALVRWVSITGLTSLLQLFNTNLIKIVNIPEKKVFFTDMAMNLKCSLGKYTAIICSNIIHKLTTKIGNILCSSIYLDARLNSEEVLQFLEYILIKIIEYNKIVLI